MHSRNKSKTAVAFAQTLHPAKLFMLIASLQIFTVIGWPIVNATAQPKINLPTNSPINSPRQTPPAQPQKTNIPTQTPSKQKSILESLLSLLQRKTFLGGSRNGGGFCGIAPAVLGEANVIWSDRPLFFWQGKIQTLELRPYAFDVAYKNQSMLWNARPTDQQVDYPNQPLQPGQRYEWQATYLSPQTNKPIQWQRTFQIMAEPERDRIEQDLNALEMQLKTQNATVEEAALARSHYFANQDLWSDALQQIYAIGHPFDAGNAFLEATTDRVCHAKPSNLVDSVSIR